MGTPGQKILSCPKDMGYNIILVFLIKTASHQNLNTTNEILRSGCWCTTEWVILVPPTIKISFSVWLRTAIRKLCIHNLKISYPVLQFLEFGIGQELKMLDPKNCYLLRNGVASPWEIDVNSCIQKWVERQWGEPGGARRKANPICVTGGMIKWHPNWK